MRKTVTYLNRLKADVDSTLQYIESAGTDVDSAAYDLSKILACDLKADSANVKIKLDALLDAHEEMGKQLDSFRIARNKYLEFF
jgi:hypothetical protein